MTADSFVRKLKQLGHTPATASELLGISRASAFNYASGAYDVPLVVEYLLDMYLRHGVPRERPRGKQ